MREFRSYGSARGAAGNSRPYREKARNEHISSAVGGAAEEIERKADVASETSA